MRFLLWTIGFHESTNFDTFKCSDEYFSNYSCHFPYHKSIFLQILHDSSLSWNITPLYFFRSKVIYFSQKELMKVRFFKLFSARKNSENLTNFLVLKIHQVLVIFEKKKWLFSWYLSVSWDITPCYLSSWSFIFFQQKEPIKVQFWWNFVWAVESQKWAPFVKVIQIFG